MFWFIKKVYVGLLTSTVNASNHTKLTSISNQKCTTQRTLINLKPNEFTQALTYSSFAVKLDRCAGGCDTLNYLSSKVRVPNKTEDLNLSVFHMITRINEWEILAKHVSCKCECTFDIRKYNSNQNWNNDKCWCKCKSKKKHHVCKKYTWNPATCSYKNGKTLASIIDDSEIQKHENDNTITVPTNFNKEKGNWKTKQKL